MSPLKEKIVHLVAWLFHGSSYLVPYLYANIHWNHHKYTDTPKDPHSPVFFKNPILLLKNTRKCYLKIMKSSYNDYTMTLMEKIADSWFTRGIWTSLYALLYWILIPPQYWFLWILFPVTVSMSVLQGMIINYVGHKYGYRNFNSKDNSHNTFRKDFLMIGELYQNNHHHRPKLYSLEVKEWELDITARLGKLFRIAK